jgi:hypothetical protein
MPTGLDHLVVGALALAAAVGAALASGEAAGWAPADVAWRAGLGALAVLAGARARRWTWLVAAGAGAAAAPDLLTAAPALVALVAAVANVAVGRRTRMVGALVLALATQSLLRLELAEPHGLASLVAAAALAPALVTGHQRSRHRARRVVKVAIAAGFLLALGLAVGQAVAVLDARSSVAVGIDAARAGFDAARSGEEAAAVEEFVAVA